MESNVSCVPPALASDLLARAQPFGPDPPSVDGTCGRPGRIGQDNEMSVEGRLSWREGQDRIRNVQLELAARASMTRTDKDLAARACLWARISPLRVIRYRYPRYIRLSLYRPLRYSNASCSNSRGLPLMVRLFSPFSSSPLTYSRRTKLSFC
jgi:hypothetical protein